MAMTATTPRRDFNLSPGDIGQAQSSSAPRATGTADVLIMPRFPTFSYSVENAASREAGRLNARATAPAEHKALLEERQRLLDKHFTGALTKKERNRLRYVRWTLDRVDDARHGADLERLESMVGQYEKFQSDIASLLSELSRLKNEPQR